jgi:hypothetical protein
MLQGSRSESPAHVFSYDKFLLFIGTIASICHGGIWPVFALVFGDLLDSFNVANCELIFVLSLIFVFPSFSRRHVPVQPAIVS